MAGIIDNPKQQSVRKEPSIIKEIGAQNFFQHIYLTNISWFGFERNGKNMNYYELQSPFAQLFTESFLTEMDIIQPACIIPLSKEVEATLLQMKDEQRLKYPLAPRLPHPYYCSMGDRAERYKDMYLQRIAEKAFRGGNP